MGMILEIDDIEVNQLVAVHSLSFLSDSDQGPEKFKEFSPVPPGYPLQVLSKSLPFITCSILQPGGGQCGPAVIDLRHLQLCRVTDDFVESVTSFEETEEGTSVNRKSAAGVKRAAQNSNVSEKVSLPLGNKNLIHFSEDEYRETEFAIKMHLRCLHQRINDLELENEADRHEHNALLTLTEIAKQALVQLVVASQNEEEVNCVELTKEQASEIHEALHSHWHVLQGMEEADSWNLESAKSAYRIVSRFLLNLCQQGQGGEAEDDFIAFLRSEISKLEPQMEQVALPKAGGNHGEEK